jgi:anti-anti-sigma regulatory factor
MRIETRVEVTGVVTLVVGGTLNSSVIADLDRSLAHARELREPIVLDLREVALIDSPALKYLIDMKQNDVGLVICPDYVEHWMERESSRQSSCEA